MMVNIKLFPSNYNPTDTCSLIILLLNQKSEDNQIFTILLDYHYYNILGTNNQNIWGYFYNTKKNTLAFGFLVVTLKDEIILLIVQEYWGIL